jgi:hypothetical protein
LAIYHLTANIISRGRGQSAVAAAAYRSGVALRDARYGVTHRYSGKPAIAYSEIMAPAAAPAWVRDRERLWNEVEAKESRKDAQLARLIEIGLPIELIADERLALLRDYIATAFVAEGMIADFCIRSAEGNPHAHILLTLRVLTPSGFGPKERSWNGKAKLLGWRAAWAACANSHLARAGHGVRIDHRTLEAQQIELTPGRRIGVGGGRQGDAILPGHLLERIDEQRRIADSNGEAILADPTVALRALTHQRSVFTRRELVQFLRSRTGTEEQLEKVVLAIMQSPDCIALDRPGDFETRFTSRDLIEAEASLVRRARSMAARHGHRIDATLKDLALACNPMDALERRAFDCLMDGGDVKAFALSERAAAVVVAAARHAWHAGGFDVLTGKPQPERDPPSRSSVVLTEGAHLLALKDLERTLAAADHARALAVFVADVDQLCLMKAAPPLQTLMRLLAPAVEASG